MTKTRKDVRPARLVLCATAVLSLAFAYGCGSKPATIGPRGDYAALAERLEQFIAHEMNAKELAALSIALVDDQEIVWARGFGLADPDRGRSASADTVYRVGSISKLFTAAAVMQLVERGELDLDAPVSRYLPDFAPHNPFDKPITLRQLLAHRSGLPHEPPVGHYYDATGPPLSAVVESLNQTTLLYEPGTRTHYSNAAYPVAGYLLERMRGRPFAELLEETVLKPLGMRHSAFDPKAPATSDLAKGYMWTYGGRVFEAPRFPSGKSPSGGLSSSVVDLSRFVQTLFRSPHPLLRRETLEEMWKVQYGRVEEKARDGIGFNVWQLEGQLCVGHSGSGYGFASDLVALPEAKLGVVVATSKDWAVELVQTVAWYTSRSMLALREGRPLPPLNLTDPVDPQLVRRLRGRYSNGDRAIELIERNHRLFLDDGRTRGRLRSIGQKLVLDDVFAYGPVISLLDEDTIFVGDDRFVRVSDGRPRSPHQRWLGLIGEYGPDYNTLYILEREGQLYALIEWFLYYPLLEISRDVFAFPDWGAYHGERLSFTRDRSGRATRVDLANVVFDRQAVGAGPGGTPRVRPLRPVEELRREALAAHPPLEQAELRDPDLVDLSALDPTLIFDIRYAGTDNFLATVFYEQAKAFLQRPAAEALLRAHRKLRRQGFGLLIHDAYRPWFVTKMFWEATPEDKRAFVADPSSGSRHNRGCAVDVTLYDLKTGKAVEMVGAYDEFSPRSYPTYPGGTSLQRWRRDLLRDALESEGFEVYEFEWWHFDHEDWQHYPILNQAFEQILRRHVGPPVED